MKENKHIEKELLFKNNVKDITSISLDSNYNIEESKVVGEFLIDGEYKIHELSINKEKFNFKIPFEYELERNINKDSVKVEITDFTYDYKKDELIVNIDYMICGDKEDIIEFETQELLDEYLRDREVDIVSDKVNELEIEEDNRDTEESNTISEIIPEEKKKSTDDIEEEKDNRLESIKNTINEEINTEERLDDIKIEPLKEDIDTKDNFINEVVNQVDNKENFITYKVYKLNENESIESLVMKYHTTIDDLKEYNDISNINIGDKIIIPIHE